MDLCLDRTIERGRNDRRLTKFKYMLTQSNVAWKEASMLPRFLTGLFAIALIGMGCSSQQPTAPTGAQQNDLAALNDVYGDSGDESAAVSAKAGHGHDGDYDHAYGGHHDHGGAMMFTVRIEDVSTNMTLHLSNGETAPAPVSPGVWTITRLFNPLFRIGWRDLGLGMEQQAEDGNPANLAESMSKLPWVKASGVFTTPVGDTDPGPATPGKAFEFTITASPGDRLSLSSMFGQSNDLFYSPGVIGIPLFRWNGRPISGDVTKRFSLWDAGTEVNQEPGLGPDQAPRQSGPNTGESESMRVRRVHDEYTYPATGDVIKVTITPVGPA